MGRSPNTVQISHSLPKHTHTRFVLGAQRVSKATDYPHSNKHKRLDTQEKESNGVFQTNGKQMGA